MTKIHLLQDTFCTTLQAPNVTPKAFQGQVSGDQGRSDQLPGTCCPAGAAPHLLQGQVGPVPEQPAMVDVEHGPQDASLGGQARPRQPLAGDVAPPPQRRQPPHCGKRGGGREAGHRLSARRRTDVGPPRAPATAPPPAAGEHRPTNGRKRRRPARRPGAA